MFKHFAVVFSTMLILGAAPQPKPREIAMPNGAGGIGFDDLRFAPAVSGVLIPSGRTGMIHVLDAAKGRLIISMAVGSTSKDYAGGHGEGITSADAVTGKVFAVDRTTGELLVVDPEAGRVTSRAKLSASPDYVRFVAATGEVWVTEPDAEKIEVFSLVGGAPKSASFIAIPGGPESLVYDDKRAFTHLWKGATVAIDLAKHTVSKPWKNGCDGDGSRGIALDAERKLLFTGCAEGKVTAIDITSGALVGSAPAAAGLDIIDYDQSRRHVYAPGGRAKTLTIVGVEDGGTLKALGSLPAPEGTHCAASDGAGHAVVCDPKGGRVLVYEDPFPRN